MPDQRQQNLRRLIITSQNLLRRGEKDGKEWELWGFDVTKEDDTPIDAQFKAFSKLPLGLGEFEVERQEHEKYGTSFLLKPKKGARMEALERRVVELEQRVEVCERALSSIGTARPQPQAQPEPEPVGDMPGWADPNPPF